MTAQIAQRRRSICAAIEHSAEAIAVTGAQPAAALDLLGSWTMSTRAAAGFLLLLFGCTSAKELGPGVYMVNKASSKSDPDVALHDEARDLCGPAYLHSTVDRFTESVIIGGRQYVDTGGRMTVVCASSPELAARFRADSLRPSPAFPSDVLERLRATPR